MDLLELTQSIINRALVLQFGGIPNSPVKRRNAISDKPKRWLSLFRQDYVPNENSWQLSCLCQRIVLQKCLFVSLRPSLSLVTFRRRLRISALVFPSVLRSLVSHHYSFSESLLSLLRYASPHAPHEAQCVCNLRWLTHRKSRHVLRPNSRCRLVPSEPAGDCAVQGLIVIVTVRACVCVISLQSTGILQAACAAD